MLKPFPSNSAIPFPPNVKPKLVRYPCHLSILSSSSSLHHNLSPFSISFLFSILLEAHLPTFLPSFYSFHFLLPSISSFYYILIIKFLHVKIGILDDQTPDLPFGDMEDAPNYLFDKPDTEDTILFDQDGLITATSLEKLIERVTYHESLGMFAPIPSSSL